jgi:two-component system sensor histidine kinase YesM
MLRLSLRKRFYLAFSGFVLFPLIVLGWMSYEVSSKILKDQISQHMLDTQDAINLNINSIMGEVNLFTDYVITSESVQYYLNKREWQFTSERVLMERSITRLLFSYPFTYDFLLINEEREPLYFISPPKVSYKQMIGKSYFQEIKSRKGAPYWIGPLKNQELVGKEQSLFTVGRSVLHPNTLEPIGFLFLHIRPDVLSNTNQIAKNSDSEWLILNEEGSIIYSTGNELINEDLSIYTERISSKQTGSTMFKREDGKEFLLTYSPTFSGWTLVSVKSWESVNAQIVPIRIFTIILVIVLLFLFTIFHRTFSQKLITFFTILKGKMAQTTKENLQVEMPDFKEPEFQTLSNGFNDMVEKLKVMIKLVEEEQKQKQQAEFKVLQHQINPHFLYNTLESVNALSSLNKTREVEKMVTNLGKLLRISLKGPYDITFREELRHVTSYLEIQKIRHDYQFNYESRIDGQVEDLPVLKLILQPLVENSIEHGIHHDTFNMIKIAAQRKNDQLIIDVKDNGPGFSIESLENLSRKDVQNNQGHGVLNVHERLRMYYGKKSGLMICSSTLGTSIRIHIPISLKGDE